MSHLKPFGNDDEDFCYEKMEEDLTCPVCLELYADPLMMPCSHSVCKACLNEIRASRQKVGLTEFECPTCRDKHPMNDELLGKLPKNLALENIVFRYQEIKSSSLVKKGRASTSFNQPAASVNVDICKESDAVFEEIKEVCQCGMCAEESPNRADWFCPQCQVLYCQQCLDTYHPRRGSLGRHRICKPTYRDAPMMGLPCPEHTEEKVSIFCDTCQTIACHLCVCQGQGSHGSHVILDLETAQKQIQATISKAKEDLSSLISVFTLKERELESQLESMKSVKDSADSHIKSQYQCILSDVAATLSLSKHKFTNTLASSLTEHIDKLYSKSQDAKVSLLRCQKLRDTCNGLLTSKQNKSLSSLSSLAKNEDRLSIAEASLNADSSGSSLEGSFIETNLVIDEDGKETSSPCAQGSKEKSVGSKEMDAGKLSGDAKVVDTNSTSKKKEKNKTKSSTEQRIMTSTPISFQSAGDGVESSQQSATPSRRQNSVSIVDENEKDQVVRVNRSIVEGKKQSVDRQNSEKKISEKHSNMGRERSESDGKRPESSRAPSVCEETRTNQDEGEGLLTQAKEIGPLLHEITALTNEIQQTSTYEEEALNEITKGVWGSVSDFGRASLSLLSDLSDMGKEEMDIPSIVPSVRSSVSPISPNQKGLPRVQSRVLLTWGFNSTSFTAEPIPKSAQWTVTVARNTSHIGDVHSGYLFGVGIAKRSLASKEQVGMNADSYGIICYKGSLAFCHNDQVSPIVPLPDLPLSIRLSVISGVKGVIFSYSLLLNAASGAVQGRRMVSLRDENSADSNDLSSEGVRQDGCEMYPVFTVTQRVKMQFPLTSDI